MAGKHKGVPVSFDKVQKSFGAIRVLEEMNLQVEPGEFLVLLGASGSGKTTALRILSGLETATEGRVLIGDRDVTNILPKYRDISMVFQSYALYPHKTVAENIGFPLKVRKVPQAELDQAVRDAAAQVQLGELLHRYPRELSGGQRQRVALARAIIRRPSVFLMDEPLSNLDAKLRGHMRAELKHMQEILRHHDDLRHPRPDRGHDAGPPRRHPGARRVAAAGNTGRNLQQPGQPLCGTVYWFPAHEHHSRCPAG